MLTGRPRTANRSGRLDRQLDVREHLDLLRLAVLEDFEVVARQAGDEVALLIGDDRVDVDVVHLDLKGDRRGSLCRRASRAERTDSSALRHRSAGLQAGGEQQRRADNPGNPGGLHGMSHYKSGIGGIVGIRCWDCRDRGDPATPRSLTTLPV